MTEPFNQENKSMNEKKYLLVKAFCHAQATS